MTLSPLLDGVRQFAGVCAVKLWAGSRAVGQGVMFCFTSTAHFWVCVCPRAGFAGFQAGSAGDDGAAGFYRVKPVV